MNTFFALEPIMGLDPQVINGVEALCREYDRNGVLKLPEDFNTRLMRADFREFVLIEAIERTANWIESELNRSTYVSININPVELQNITFLEKLLVIMRATAICTTRFHFEITEGFTDIDIFDLNKVACLLAHHGVELYLDDFGSGYRPFTYLMELPIAGIKLDKSIIRKNIIDKRTRYIIQSCQILSKLLGINVIIEGIESLEDEMVALSCGIRQAQGHFYNTQSTIV